MGASDLSFPEVAGSTARLKAVPRLTKLLESLSKTHAAPIIMGIDANTYNPKESELFRAALAEEGFVDAHAGSSDRVKSRHAFVGTDKQAPKGTAGRIDYIWVKGGKKLKVFDSGMAKGIVEWMENGRRMSGYASDHHLIWADFKAEKGIADFFSRKGKAKAVV
jgi:hypothetical protein